MRLPSRRAVFGAALPAVIVFAVFWRWLGLALPLSVAAGVAWGLASLLVTRAVYDDADEELAAWRAAFQDMATTPPAAATEPPEDDGAGARS